MTVTKKLMLKVILLIEAEIRPILKKEKDLERKATILKEYLSKIDLQPVVLLYDRVHTGAKFTPKYIGYLDRIRINLESKTGKVPVLEFQYIKK